MSYLTKEELKIVGSRPIRPDGVDKVTGRASFGADLSMPGMIWGKVKRSPHAHARILSINTEKAAALPGVKAIITRADFPDVPPEKAYIGEAPANLRDLSRNCMAKGKALYEGHAVAAVAAVSPAVAERALDLIEVEYEVLPHVMDVEAAMASDAPLLHDDVFTVGVDPKPQKPSNIAKVVRFAKGDIEAGFAEAEVVIERRYTTKPVHQAYIEPHACVVAVAADGQCTIWSSSQGQFMVRGYTSRIVGADIADIRAIPAEIGGGFGGKTIVYLEPLAYMLSKKSGRPVKMVMSREEVFRASGPTSGGVIEVKLGAKRDGTLVATQVVLKYQAGAFPGSPVNQGSMCAFAAYDVPNVLVTGYDVVCNRPKVAAYRAPGSPIAAFGVESCMDELARELKLDPLALRAKNAAKDGTKAAHGPTWANIGYINTVEAARQTEHYKTPLGPNQGRGVASGFWFNAGGESSAAVHVNEDGTVTVTEGHPDIGGSRASMAMMVAEVLGVPYDRVRPVVGDTTAIGFSAVTGGSRVTFAGGMAVTRATERVVDELKKRAAITWDISPEAVEWKEGQAFPAGPNAGSFEPLSLGDLAAKAAKTGGPISAEVQLNAQGAGPGFATHICDVEIDRETGFVKILRYTAVQDVGRAIHPAYVEGQMQGGVAQGVGWALNEEYIYDQNGRLENPGFLDYRVPVASDMPMIETVMVEVPNPRHPFGARGVGEVPIVPPMATVANAIADAIGIRLRDLPMSPPRLLAALDPEPIRAAAE
ncbi:MAG: xanthine dehydrogenase family protein molybdopterin-binding subunit [Alphaproteobacteria bacterium]|nr:xanthine dehydrogenase family protein molybdopterin-binding subunit [Alphaproteobacteria bacterium]